MTSKQISLEVPEDMLNSLDKLRGEVPRSAFIRKLIKNAISSKGGKRKNG